MSKAQKQWESKFAEMVNAIAPELEELAPVEAKTLKALANSVNETNNVTADEALEKGKWSSSTPVLQQTEDANCGAAAVAMLSKSKGGKEAVADEQLMGELSSRFATKEGTTPKQLAHMLANEGIAVKRGATHLDKDALDGALQNGGKAVAMVDSNEITAPVRGGAKEPGKAHWVVIDGMDDQGRYMVKDPGTASSYFVKADELNKAIDSGRNQHQAGGMLIVENAQDAAPAPVLAEEATRNAEALGNTPGGGSMAWRFGRESS